MSSSPRKARVPFETAIARLERRDKAVSESGVRAAVAAILRSRGDATEVLFIERAARPGDHWSGHIAFPGGRRQTDDASLVATAARETREEVGLDLAAHARLVTTLPPVPARFGGMLVAACVYALDDADDLALTPNHEVADAFWSPIEPMLAGEVNDTHLVEREGVTWNFPCYRVGDRIVWGLTFHMLTLLFERIRAA